MIDQAEGRKEVFRPPTRKFGGGKRKSPLPLNNEHMKDVLKSHDGMANDQAQ